MKLIKVQLEEERKALIEKGFKEIGKDDNDNYMFKSNKTADILSKREMEVFKLQHKSNAEIAEILEVSEKTIISYRKKIKSKGSFYS